MCMYACVSAAQARQNQLGIAKSDIKIFFIFPKMWNLDFSL